MRAVLPQVINFGGSQLYLPNQGWAKTGRPSGFEPRDRIVGSNPTGHVF
jgi:hypothetical protein